MVDYFFYTWKIEMMSYLVKIWLFLFLWLLQCTQHFFQGFLHNRFVICSAENTLSPHIHNYCFVILFLTVWKYNYVAITDRADNRKSWSVYIPDNEIYIYIKKVVLVNPYSAGKLRLLQIKYENIKKIVKRLSYSSSGYLIAFHVYLHLP